MTNVSWLQGLGLIGLVGPIAAALSFFVLGKAAVCLLVLCVPTGLASVSALAAVSGLKNHDR